LTVALVTGSELLVETKATKWLLCMIEHMNHLAIKRVAELPKWLRR
jgi:hypothetical protein